MLSSVFVHHHRLCHVASVFSQSVSCLNVVCCIIKDLRLNEHWDKVDETAGLGDGGTTLHITTATGERAQT